jgi:hypothetical protein
LVSKEKEIAKLVAAGIIGVFTGGMGGAAAYAAIQAADAAKKIFLDSVGNN